MRKLLVAIIISLFVLGIWLILDWLFLESTLTNNIWEFYIFGVTCAWLSQSEKEARL